MTVRPLKFLIDRYDSPNKCPTILYVVNLWLKPVSLGLRGALIELLTGSHAGVLCLNSADPPEVFQRNIIVTPLSMGLGDHVNGGLVEESVSTVISRRTTRCAPLIHSHILYKPVPA